MKSTKLTWSVALIFLLSIVIAGCGGGSSSSSGSSSSTSITFWAAPNPPQQAFWSAMAKAYMASHSGVQITVTAMPESPTSEAAVQAAIAGGTAPTASENIFSGFASTLVNDQAVVPLDQMPGWNDVIQARHMTQTIQGWKFGDNHTYVLPLYTNAMLVGWRMDILKQIGYNTPPQTFSQILAMGQKLKQKFPDKFVWANNALVQDTWWQRWFDFFIFYNAASHGQSFVNGTQLTADDQAAVATLQFFNQLEQNKLLLTQNVTDPFETGVCVMQVIGPWTFPTWAQKYPNLKYNDTYTLTPPPVPDGYPAGQPVKTFADAKGVVIYKQASQEQQMAAWQFIKWVLSDPQHDLQWLQKTNLPPARDDLSTNSLFTTFFNQNPELAPYAQEIPYAIPPMKNPNYVNLQTALGDDALLPVIKGQKAPEQAWNDWKSAAQPMLSSNS
jgi:multiple sugar transport system substrate-binding protein